MAAPAEAITFIFPKDIAGGLVSLSDSLLDRMHALLERNTDGELSDLEKSELETLVRITQFGQILATAIQPTSKP